MKRGFGEILEDKDEIELLEAELYAFQRCDLDICQCDHQKWRIGKMDQAFGCWLEANVGSEGNSLK